jgi:hypothetical protein
MDAKRFIAGTFVCLGIVTRPALAAERLMFNSVAPCRIIDTRLASAGALGAGETRAFHVVGSTSDFAGQGGQAGGCGLPGFAAPGRPRVQAALINFVAVAPAGAGHLTAWASDGVIPLASVLNYAKVTDEALGVSFNVANAIAVPVRQDVQGGDISINAAPSSTHVVADVVGYWQMIGPGSYNTFVGESAGNFTVTGVSNTAIGQLALHNVAAGDGNTACGEAALVSTTGAANTGVGAVALGNDTSGFGNSALGWRADVSAGNLTNATAIGYTAVVDASNKIRLGNADVTVIEGQVAYTFTSDRNQKENLQSVDGEEVLRKLRDVSVTSWNYVGHDPQHFRHYGPVAQEFFAAFGNDGIGAVGSPTTINSGDMAGILMIAVQTLAKRSEEQARELQRLRAENASLKTRHRTIE